MWTEIDVPICSTNQLVEITGVVADEVRECGVDKGTCLVYVPNATAGVTINENADPEWPGTYWPILHAWSPRRATTGTRRGTPTPTSRRP
jgi:thiamine phosphate synthase YjbQ (UPF0047 family)